MERGRRSARRTEDGALRFWDSSAVVPLLLAQRATSAIRRAYAEDGEMLVWWATEVECVSAIARGEREGRVTARSSAQSVRRLDDLRGGWNEVEASDPVRDTARRLLRVHEVRAPDALQLAAALVGSENRPPTLPFVSLDTRLADAARREGFPVLELDSG